MTSLDIYHELGEEIQRRLLLRTYPIAVKLLKPQDDIPEGATRPKRDLGYHLGLCQGFAMSRRDGATMAFLKEDHWCYVPVLALGLARPPAFVLDGNMDYPLRMADPEAAQRIAQNAAHLEYGTYTGIISAPLRSTPFQPDVVVAYANSAQLRSLLIALRYKHGYVVNTKLEPGGACVHATIPVLQTGECNVVVPCQGDRMVALAQDDEMIFSIPAAKLDDLMLGLRHFDQAGLGFPIKFRMRPDYPMWSTYMTVGRMIGMDMPPKE